MHCTLSKIVTLAGLLILALALPAAGENWPNWRGPRGDGVTVEKGLPTTWGTDQGIAWKVAIPGIGHSSPVVWDKRLFLTTCEIEKLERSLVCLDRDTGKILWRRVVFKGPLEPKNDLNSYASATPATDGRHVYAAFLDAPQVLVVCYDMEGKEIWRKNPGKFFSKHGWSSSPILYKHLVILNCDHDGDGYLLALDKSTGEEKWRVDRPNKTRSYCVPLIVEAAGKMQLVMSGSKCVASYDPGTGREYWIMDGPTEQFVASPVFAGGVFFITGGYPEHHLIGIKPDGSGNVTKTHLLWHDTKNVSYVPSPVAVGDRFYLVSDEGFASCLDAKTGKRLWMHRLGKHHRPSPIAGDGLIYFLDDDGTTWVVKAADKFEVVARNALNEECNASPAVADGLIYIRTLHTLFCIGPKSTPSEK